MNITDGILLQITRAIPDKWLERMSMARELVSGNNGQYSSSIGFNVVEHIGGAKESWLLSSIRDGEVEFGGPLRTHPGDLPAVRRFPSTLSPAEVPKTRPVNPNLYLDFLGRCFSDFDIDGRSFRNYPSAGGLYSVQVILATRENDKTWILHHHLPVTHAFEQYARADSQDLRAVIGGNQLLDPLDCEALVFYAILPALSAAKYGPRGYKFAMVEIGLMAQLAAESGFEQNLTSRLWGYFDEHAIAAALGLRNESVWVELIQAFGHKDMGS